MRLRRRAVKEQAKTKEKQEKAAAEKKQAEKLEKSKAEAEKKIKARATRAGTSLEAVVASTPQKRGSTTENMTPGSGEAFAKEARLGGPQTQQQQQ